VAIWSDTGGSVRIPSACCGTAGLKTTWGRVSTEGVWPLAPSLDTIGPMARDVAGLTTGMALLEPGFTVTAAAPSVVGYLADPSADPEVSAAVERALAATGWEVVEVELAAWEEVPPLAAVIVIKEAFASDGALLAARPDGISPAVAELIRGGEHVTEAQLAAAKAAADRLRAALSDLFSRVELLATPTLPRFAPLLDDEEDLDIFRHMLPVNLAGVPALALPVPTPGALPASLQLVGPWEAEAALLAAGAVVEAAVA